MSVGGTCDALLVGDADRPPFPSLTYVTISDWPADAATTSGASSPVTSRTRNAVRTVLPVARFVTAPNVPLPAPLATMTLPFADIATRSTSPDGSSATASTFEGLCASATVVGAPHAPVPSLR